MRPVMGQHHIVARAPPDFDDGDPHLVAIAAPKVMRGGFWVIAKNALPARHVAAGSKPPRLVTR